MLLIALLQIAPTTIDYSTVAKPLPSVLRELSSISGEEWRATKALQGELLVVRVKDASKDVLRKHVADAVVGRWYQDGKAWVLRSDEAKLRKRADAVRRVLSRQLEEKVTEIFDNIADLPEFDDSQLSEHASEGMDASSDAADWLLANALRQLNCYDVVGFPEGEQIVFSTTNNRLQSPLRLGGPMLEQALRMQNRLADAYARANVEEPEVGTYEHELRQRQIAKWRGPLRVVLIIEWENDELETRCLVMDGSNKVAERAYETFRFDRELTVKTSDDLGSKVPEYSQDTVLFERFASYGPGVPQLEDFDPKFLTKMRKPTAHDPLSFTVSDYLAETGRLADWNVVARPYDEMYEMDSDGNPTTLASWLDYLQRITSIHVEQKDNWLIIGPSGFRAKRQIDRKALEDFISCGQDRIPTLDEAADYALVSVDNLLEMNYLPPFVGFYQDWTWLRFYGTLPNALRTRLWNQEVVQVGELPEAAIGCLERILLNDDAYKDYEYWYNDAFYASHITDLLPSGIPKTSRINAKVKNDYCLLQTKPRNLRSRSYARTLDSIAENAARRQYFDAEDTAQFPWSLAPFIVGSHREMDISVRIGPLVYGDILSDPNVSRRGTPVTATPLPVSMQKSFEEAVSRHFKRISEDGGR